MLQLPAPAKLNLMLHITGRRPDGYHNLQTLFQFVDFGDQLSFSPRDDGVITLSPELPGTRLQDNLIYRAAQCLIQHTGTQLGADIQIDKCIPMGGGLGGGSSNAATALLGLNQLWQTGLSLEQLADLGLALGADVPVFIHGRAAWAEGVGEQLTPVTLAEPAFLVITPDCQVSTVEIFSNQQLTRNTSPITIAAALEQGGRNDCQTVVTQHYPQVQQALDWLDQQAPNALKPAMMTGTGASIFTQFDSLSEAEAILAQLPTQWQGFAAKGCNISPLHQALSLGCGQVV